MEKKLYKFYLVSFLFLFVSCKSENSKTEIKKVDEKNKVVVKQVISDSSSFLMVKTSEINKKGLKMIENGRFDEAKIIFEESLKSEPKNAITFNNLALIAANEGDFETANAYFKKAIYYDSTYFPAYINFSSLLIDNDYFTRSISINDYIIKHNKNNEFENLANYFNTYAYLALKDCDKAQEFCVKAKKWKKFSENIKSSLQNLDSEIKKCLELIR